MISLIGFFVRVIISLGLLIGFVWFVGFIWFVAQVERMQPPTDIHADGIVVLTGGAGRVEEGLKLLADGHAKQLLISGVHHDVGKRDLLMASVQPQNLTEQTRNCCIALGYEAGTTYGNAVEAADWARAEKFKSLIVVTAQYHVPRALIEFHRALPSADLIPYPLARENIAISHWWDAPNTAKFLAVEYTKYGGALLRSVVPLVQKWI